jgi:hypothetical protein
MTIQEIEYNGKGIITQLWWPNIEVVQFATILPHEFAASVQSNIVAVWHIKPKQLA